MSQTLNSTIWHVFDLSQRVCLPSAKPRYKNGPRASAKLEFGVTGNDAGRNRMRGVSLAPLVVMEIGINGMSKGEV